MIYKGKIALTLMLLLGTAAASQNNDTRIGDDYARAALRAVIYTKEGAVDAQFISSLLVEADVAASTAAEEASLKEVKRIVGVWFNSTIADHQACYLALKASLKARSSVTPEPCK
jgi:hypothetical protein